jgi:NO-binding membrane sensor protein with MHYT domain
LLLVDAAINLALGIPLTFFPRNTAAFLGVSVSEIPFYASLLGAVLVGIGIALLVEHFKGAHKLTGLGLGGAIFEIIAHLRRQ